MANNVYQTVQDCHSCAAQRGTMRKTQKPLRLFPPSGTLKLIAIDILVPLPRTSTGFTSVVVMTDRVPKLARSVPLRRITAPYVTTDFLDHWIIPYGIPYFLLSDQRPQYLPKVFRHSLHAPQNQACSPHTVPLTDERTGGTIKPNVSATYQTF